MSKIDNRIKFSFYNYSIYYLILTILIPIFLIVYFNKEIKNYFILLIQNQSQDFNYILKNIKIIGNKRVQNIEIDDLFENEYGKSIFLLPIKEMKKKIEEKNWIKESNFKIIYPSTIKIEIKEKNPIAIYLEGNNYYFLDEKGLKIQKLEKEDKIKHILISGDESLDNFLDFNSIIKQYKILNINSANFIGSRRWDIIIDEEIKVKLPERNIDIALENLREIINNIDNMSQNSIEFIDLRIPKKAIISFDNYQEIEILKEM